MSTFRICALCNENILAHSPFQLSIILRLEMEKMSFALNLSPLKV